MTGHPSSLQKTEGTLRVSQTVPCQAGARVGTEQTGTQWEQDKGRLLGVLRCSEGPALQEGAAAYPIPRASETQSGKGRGKKK